MIDILEDVYIAINQAYMMKFWPIVFYEEPARWTAAYFITAQYCRPINAYLGFIVYVLIIQLIL